MEMKLASKMKKCSNMTLHLDAVDVVVIDINMLFSVKISRNENISWHLKETFDIHFVRSCDKFSNFSTHAAIIVFFIAAKMRNNNINEKKN